MTTIEQIQKQHDRRLAALELAYRSKIALLRERLAALDTELAGLKKELTAATTETLSQMHTLTPVTEMAAAFADLVSATGGTGPAVAALQKRLYATDRDRALAELERLAHAGDPAAAIALKMR